MQPWKSHSESCIIFFFSFAQMPVNKEEDDKMRTTAANVAARAAVGGDDMLSKWTLMAQARHKREGGPETSSQTVKEAASNKQPTAPVGNVGQTRGTGKIDSSAALSASGKSSYFNIENRISNVLVQNIGKFDKI